MKYLIAILIVFFSLNTIPVVAQEKEGISKIENYSLFLEKNAPYLFQFCQYLPATGDSICGSLIYGGKRRFKILFPEEEILFDGKYLWSYSAVNNQTIVEDYDISLMTLIPPAFFTGDWSGYTVLGDSTSSGWKFLIKSEDLTAYKLIIMVFDASVQNLKAVDYLDFNNNHIRFVVNKSGPYDKPVSFEYRKHGDEELIDLRVE